MQLLRELELEPVMELYIQFLLHHFRLPHQNLLYLLRHHLLKILKLHILVQKLELHLFLLLLVLQH
jgi:hypothetical protein